MLQLTQSPSATVVFAQVQRPRQDFRTRDLRVESFLVPFVAVEKKNNPKISHISKRCCKRNKICDNVNVFRQKFEQKGEDEALWDV